MKKRCSFNFTVSDIEGWGDHNWQWPSYVCVVPQGDTSPDQAKSAIKKKKKFKWLDWSTQGNRAQISSNISTWKANINEFRRQIISTVLQGLPSSFPAWPCKASIWCGAWVTGFTVQGSLFCKERSHTDKEGPFTFWHSITKTKRTPSPTI